MKLEDVKIGKQYICIKEQYRISIGGTYEYHDTNTRENIINKLFEDEVIISDFEVGEITSKVTGINNEMGIIVFEKDSDYKYLGIKISTFLELFEEVE